MAMLNGMPDVETTEFLLSKIDDFGTPKAYNHYAVGWAHAMNTPYQWTKQVASHWGGTRNGTIVHWPNGFADKAKTRNQFHHVIDVAPTILDAAGLPAPISVNGIQQAPLEGVSMLPTLRDGESPDTQVQYFEMFGNRGLHKGWTAVTRHSTPWKITLPCHLSTRTPGSSTAPTTGPRPTTWPPRTPRSSPTCSACGSSRR